MINAMQRALGSYGYVIPKAIAAGDGLWNAGTCPQQAAFAEIPKGLPAQMRNLAEDRIACRSGRTALRRKNEQQKTGTKG